MSRFGQLLDFIVTVPGLIGIACGLILCILASTHIWLRWVLFGVTMYLASLSKYYDEWEDRLWDPFNAPIELMANNGRPIAILALGALIIIACLSRSVAVRPRIPAMMAPIHCIQALIMLKVLFGGGSEAYVFQAILIYLGIALLTAVGLRSWSFLGNPVEHFSFSLLVVGFLFATITEWHVLTNPSAIFLSGRLMGTTGNPQHAAVLLGLCFLGPVYLITTHKSRPSWLLALNFVTLVMMVHLLVLTGSRTGVALLLIGTFVMLWGRLSRGFVVALLITAVVVLIFQQFWQNESVQFVTRTEDTRSHIWANQWNAFLENPVFGEPHRGEQFHVAENSWLGLMAATGVLGLGCLVWLFYEFWSAVAKLLRLRRSSQGNLEVSFCIAAIATVFAGSFFEGYLLGVITTPVLFIAAISLVTERILDRAGELQWIRSRQLRTWPVP